MYYHIHFDRNETDLKLLTPPKITKNINNERKLFKGT